ncbi:MAG: HK97 family phage prohead protease [Azospirillum sp.]|nr:HK97 family phage prohead protease [Azospirillum sp.]
MKPTPERPALAPLSRAIARVSTLRRGPAEAASPARAPEVKEAPGAARKVRAFAFELREAGADGVLEGYGAVFDTRDSYDDIIAKGAFKASLAAHAKAGTMPAMLWQHDPSEPIGVWTDMTEDARGLRVKGQLIVETERGRAALALLRKGALNGLSIGFVSREWTYDAETEIRTLTDIDLWEVSLVTFPAQALARITSVKSAAIAGVTTFRLAEKALRDAGFSEDAA